MERLQSGIPKSKSGFLMDFKRFFFQIKNSHTNISYTVRNYKSSKQNVDMNDVVKT